MERTKNGFTIIETLVSITLILMLVIFITKIILFSLDVNKKSLIRFRVLQKIEYLKNHLLSKPFDSVDLKDGNVLKNEGKFKIHWNIKGLTSSLKQIKLTVSYEALSRQSYFYKSIFF